MSKKDKNAKPKAGIKAPLSSKLRNKLSFLQQPHVTSTKKPAAVLPHWLAKKKIESRPRPVRVFDPKSLLVNAPGAKAITGGYATNTAGSPASITELARALKNDVDLIFEHVYNNIEFEPTFGLKRDPVGVLLDGYGNSFEQSNLMVALLREAGYTADLVFGELMLDAVQLNTWLDTQDDDVLPAYWLMTFPFVTIMIETVRPNNLV